MYQTAIQQSLRELEYFGTNLGFSETVWFGSTRSSWVKTRAANHCGSRTNGPEESEIGNFIVMSYRDWNIIKSIVNRNTFDTGHLKWYGSKVRTARIRAHEEV